MTTHIIDLEELILKDKHESVFELENTNTEYFTCDACVMHQAALERKYEDQLERERMEREKLDKERLERDNERLERDKERHERDTFLGFRVYTARKRKHEEEQREASIGFRGYPTPPHGLTWSDVPH